VREGHQIGDSPYYQIKVPICRIRNGEGPSIVLMAGNHGDEYEGELTLLKLIRLIEAGDVRGAIKWWWEGTFLGRVF
jgi:predicted deacylase